MSVCLERGHHGRQIDAAAIVAMSAFYIKGSIDFTILNDALDPLGGAPFRRNGVGSRWSRMHHCLTAASSLMLARFFVTFHIAGTTLTHLGLGFGLVWSVQRVYMLFFRCIENLG